MNWEGIIFVGSICFLKLIITGIPAAAVAELTFMETFIAASVGGLLGITVFVFVIDALTALLQRMFPRKKKKKIFTKKNRFIILGKQKFGLAGIAFLTPFIFSMPLGAFIALRFYSNKAKVLGYMYVAVLFWSVIGAWLALPIKEFKDWVTSLV